MDARTQTTELEAQNEIAEAMHAIYRARAILECVQMVCEGMSADAAVPIANTLEIADDLLDEAMSAVGAFQKTHATPH